MLLQNNASHRLQSPLVSLSSDIGYAPASVTPLIGTSSSKLRCKVKEPDISCERCLNRNVRCSYLPQVSRPFQSPSPAQLSQGSPNFPTTNIAQTQTPAIYQLNQETPGLDFGRGRPEDVLREGEFTHSLILLYFSNFSDMHFMFDEELFLKDFATGQVPKLILYSIMALSIRYVLSRSATLSQASL